MRDFIYFCGVKDTRNFKSCMGHSANSYLTSRQKRQDLAEGQEIFALFIYCLGAELRTSTKGLSA